MADRTYTITLKVRRTFQKKLKSSAEHRDKIKRAVTRALPEGWELAQTSVSVSGQTPKQVAKTKRDKVKREEERTRKDIERNQRSVNRAALKESMKVERAQHGGVLFRGTELTPQKKTRIAAILLLESMSKWTVLNTQGDTLECFKPIFTQGLRPRLRSSCMVVEIDSVGERVVDIRDARYLAKHGVAVMVLDQVYGQIAHDVAHVRHARKVGPGYGRTNQPKEHAVHGKKFRLYLLNVIRKHFPEACTPQAMVAQSLKVNL